MSLQTVTARFTKLQLKERRLIVIAAVAGTLLLGYSLFVEPAQLGATARQNQLTQQTTELNTLQAQLPPLRQQAGNPDAALRQDITSTRDRIGTVESELRQFDHLLVTPAQMPGLLQSMLARHRGLELTRVKTLPAQPLLGVATVTPASNSTQAQPAHTGDKPAPPPGGIYRHAIEITVAGSYAELRAYAEELQRISPRPLWSAMELKVVEYPRSELTFTLYTLSLDLPWLAV